MNNNQIDNTDYYRLPDGRQLEDYIADSHLDFAMGSALKYLWRAGMKDGETADKDLAKARHFIRFKASRAGCTEALIEKELRARIHELKELS